MCNFCRFAVNSSFFLTTLEGNPGIFEFVLDFFNQATLLVEEEKRFEEIQLSFIAGQG